MTPLQHIGWVTGLVLLSVLLSFGSGRWCGAAEGPKTVSPTFADLLTRVTRRDKETGAILEVRAKDDAPRRNFGLTFSISEVPYAGEAVVVVAEELKAGDGVFEKYRLRIDDAIRQELDNQKRYAAARPGKRPLPPPALPPDRRSRPCC
jgi:hypothetical protein